MDYPSIIQTSDKILHLVYSYSDKSKIKHVVINPYVILSEPPCVKYADVDASKLVDWLDLKFLAEYWLERCHSHQWCFGANVNHDHIVNYKDIAIFAQEYLSDCP